MIRPAKFMCACVCVGLVSCGGAPAQPSKHAPAESRPATCKIEAAADLVERVVSALKAGEAAPIACAYVPLTDDPSRGGCFDEAHASEFRTNRLPALLSEARAKCSTALKWTDWSSVKLTGFSGGDVKRGLNLCGRSVELRTDIAVQLQSGSETGAIAIDDAVTLDDGSWILTGDVLSCVASEPAEKND